MKPSTKDKVEGTLHESKGKVKEASGILANDPQLESKGKIEKLSGKAQKKIGEIEKVLDK